MKIRTYTIQTQHQGQDQYGAASSNPTLQPFSVEKLKEDVINGREITEEEALWLALEADRQQLHDAAAEITKHFGKPQFNPCTIINARSGRCSENCKWCAQSAHFKTNVQEYGVITKEQALEQALHDESKGVVRFSQVTSGKCVKGEDLERICENYRHLRANTKLFLCGSLGLLGRGELQKLWDSGMRRYHCNLETAPSFFPSLCTTHTTADKLQTLRAAREIGFELCSGGIIGMGESAEQRVELALTLREIAPDSIPINILSPVKGTPLEDTPPLTDEEILTTIAVFRFIHPKVELRFAGGRARLSREVQLEALRIGINSAVVGDLLTTIGSKIDEDRLLAQEAGYK